MNTNIIFIFLFILAFAFTIIKYYKSKLSKNTHKWRHKSAKNIHNSIKSIQHHGQIISYVRKVEPFVFEELLLISIAQNPKCKIIRNDKYTGDGGIDGKFILDNKMYIIQAKRYKSYIDSQDILDFIKKIHETQSYKGLFIHTGRTGENSWKFCSTDDNIEIISGTKLVNLIKYGY